MQTYADYTITYPKEWEEEYRQLGYIGLWRERYPDQFEDWIKSTQKLPSGRYTLDLFAQYSLTFLLREQQNVKSITWYELSDLSTTSKNLPRKQKYWATMREMMGDDDFEVLQDRTKGLNGEPDLFCWHLETKQWFFAEAKRADKLTPSQIEWFRLCKDCLADRVDHRVYKLVRGTLPPREVARMPGI